MCIKITAADVEPVYRLVPERCPRRGLNDLDVEELENLEEAPELDYYEFLSIVAVVKKS